MSAAAGGFLALQPSVAERGRGMDFAEERKVVLRMLREGRIEPDEADALLRALERAEARARDDADRRTERPEPGPGERAAGGKGPEDERRSGRRGDDLEDWFEGLGDRLEEKLEGIRERIGEALAGARSRMEQAGEEGKDELERAWEGIQRAVGQVLSELPRRFGGRGSFVRMDWDPYAAFPGHRVERSVPIPDLAPGATVKIGTRNGSVTVQGTDGPPTVLVRWRLRAESEEAARARAESLLFAGGDNQSWSLETREERGEQVDVRLALPRRGLSLDVETINGRVMVRELALDRLRLHTLNGAVDVDDVTARSAELETNNGPVRVDDFVGDTLDCRASNGPVRVQAAVRHGRLRTLNGSIDLEPAVREGDDWDDRSGTAGFGAPEATGPDTGSPDTGGTGSTRGSGAPGSSDDVPRERSYELETTNGRVRVAVPARDQVGYRFDLETQHGRIVLALEDIRSVFHDAPGRGGLRAESFHFEERPERVDVRARSRNGSIIVEAGSL